MLDPGSEASLIADKTAKAIGLEGANTSTRLSTFHVQDPDVDARALKFSILARNDATMFLPTNSLVVPNLNMSRKSQWATRQKILEPSNRSESPSGQHAVGQGSNRKRRSWRSLCTGAKNGTHSDGVWLVQFHMKSLNVTITLPKLITFIFEIQTKKCRIKSPNCWKLNPLAFRVRPDSSARPKMHEQWKYSRVSSANRLKVLS